MADHSWHRQYLSALLASQRSTIAEFETVSFFRSTTDEPSSGVQELLLHRLIAKIPSVEQALELLEVLQSSKWKSYAPRVLARIADTEAVLREQPKFANYF